MATEKKKRSKPGVSTSQKVELFIKNAIYEGRLKPRERIIEDDIARHLGCSRGPVREAVLRLEREGMIVTTPRRGTFIRDISPEDVEVIFSIRGKLEGLSVRYMRENMTPEAEAALMKCLHNLKVAADKRDDEQFLQADMKLHRTIWKLSRKQQLYTTLNSLMNPYFFMIARAYSSQVYATDEAYGNHEEYIKMILATPLARVEYQAEQYFRKLYQRIDKRVFHQREPGPGSFLPAPWAAAAALD